MNNQTYIYKIIHPDTKTIMYIGKSKIKGNWSRIDQHIHIALYQKRKTRFYDWLRNKLKKYNKKKIKDCFIIIRDDLSEVEACTLEKSLIRKYKRIEQGGTLLNHMVGGNGGAMDLNSRKKSSKSKTGKKHKLNCNCPFCRDKFGEKNSFFGKKHTDKAKIKMRKPRPSVQGKNHYRARCVILYDKKFNKIKEWSCIKDAVQETKYTKSSIIHKCKRKKKSRDGINWRYKDDR